MPRSAAVLPGASDHDHRAGGGDRLPRQLDRDHVDDAIVVVESIFRRLAGGDKPADAAARGAGDVAGAIVATGAVVIVPKTLSASPDGSAGMYFALNSVLNTLTANASDATTPKRTAAQHNIKQSFFMLITPIG